MFLRMGVISATIYLPSFHPSLLINADNFDSLSFLNNQPLSFITAITPYRLTWMFFQQLKRAHEDWIGKVPNGEVERTFRLTS